MAGFDKGALSAQLNADPRVKQFIAQRYPHGTRGAAEIPADMLRSWGYAVPDGYGVAVQGRGANVYDKHDKWDAIIPAAGGTLLGAYAPGVIGEWAAAPTTTPANVPGNGPMPTTTVPKMPWTLPGYKAPGGGIGSWLGKVGGGIVDNLFSKQGIGALASMIPALMAMKSGGNNDATNRSMDLAENAYADAQRINAMKEARFRRVDPLHEAVTQLAFNRLPTTNATNGITLNRVPLPEKK